MTDTELVKAWVELQSMPQGSTEAEAHMWAAEKIYLLALRSPKECWQVVLDILSATNDEWVLTNLGAGPIESMLSFNPEETIAMIEREAPQNSKLRSTLSNVWRNNIPDDTWSKLQAII